MINIFNKSRTERNRKSPETRDNYFRDVESGLSNLGTSIESGVLRESIQEQSVMLAKIEQDLLPKYKSLSSWIKSTEWSRTTKRHLKSRLDENIQNLEKMEDDLKKHNYTNLAVYKARLWELEYYYTHYEQVRQIVTLWWKTSAIHTVIDSKQDAKRARRYEKSDAKYQQSMNAILHDVALTSLWNDDMERYEEYLEAVANWQIEPSSHPFYKAHAQSFRMIQCTNPDLYQILTPSKKWKIQYVIPATWTIIWSAPSWNRRLSVQPESFPSRLGKWFWDVLSNIFPSIENNPRQKRAREQAGAVAALWWAIFMWYKVIKNIFSSKSENPNKRWKAAARWAGLLALVNGDKIAKSWWQRLQDAFNRHPAEKIQFSTELFQRYWFTDTDALKYSEMHIWAPVAVMSALHFIPIYELSTQKIVEYKNNEFIFNYDNYKKYINDYNCTTEQKKTILAAWEKLRDDNSINLWLTSLWIKNWNQLNWLASWSRTKTLAECQQIHDSWIENAELVASGVHSELFKQWLKAKTPESAKQIVNEYNQNWSNNIKKSDLNNLIIKWMKSWLLEINDSEKKYELEDMLNDSDIDLEKRTIKWFTNSWWTPIEFASYKELFDAKNLTNRIKKNFKWRPALSEKPFHIDAIKWRIEFDDTEWYKVRKNETDVVKFRTILNNPTLWGNREFYKDFLNNWRNAEGRIRLNLTPYPILKGLSDSWINFINEQEVQQAEIRLNKVKEMRRFANWWTPWYKPFSIEWNKLVFSTSDTENAQKLYFPDEFPEDFLWKSQNLSNFSTLLNNKEKFLDFMNDKNNWMRASALNR